MAGFTEQMLNWPGFRRLMFRRNWAVLKKLMFTVNRTVFWNLVFTVNVHDSVSETKISLLRCLHAYYEVTAFATQYYNCAILREGFTFEEGSLL